MARLRQFSPLREGTPSSLLDRVQDRLVAFLNPLAKEVERLATAPQGATADLSNDNPQALAPAASPGTGAEASRDDHKHPLPDASAIPNFNATASAAAPVQSVNGMTGAVVVPSGGLTYFAESEHTAAPNATVAANRLTPVAATTNADIVIAPKGTGALLAQVPDGTGTGGNKRGAYATDLQTFRGAATQVASGQGATIPGGQQNTASGDLSSVGGGSNNNAVGRFSTIGGGSNNTVSATGATFGGSTVGGGMGNTASAEFATVAGGGGTGGTPGNNATSSGATVGGGSANNATGTYATIAGGNDNTADGTYSAIPGGSGARTRGVTGKLAFASLTTAGAAQTSTHVTRVQTANTTPTALTAQGVAATAAQVNTLPNSSVYAVRVQVAARQATTGDVAGWEIVGLVSRGANAASTAIVGAPTVTLLGASAGAAAWTCALAANTTVGAVVVQVTGEADKTISWVATMHTTELTT